MKQVSSTGLYFTVTPTSPYSANEVNNRANDRPVEELSEYWTA